MWMPVGLLNCECFAVQEISIISGTDRRSTSQVHVVVAPMYSQKTGSLLLI